MTWLEHIIEYCISLKSLLIKIFSPVKDIFLKYKVNFFEYLSDHWGKCKVNFFEYLSDHWGWVLHTNGYAFFQQGKEWFSVVFNFFYDLIVGPFLLIIYGVPTLVLFIYKKFLEYATASFFEFLLVLIFLILIHLIVIIFILIYVAFVTVFERKTLAAVQKRKGPNWVGFMGQLQAIADAVKLFSKESNIPRQANKILFIMSPIVVFFISLAGWVLIPFFKDSLQTDLNLGVLIFFALSIVNVYGVLMAGWASNSRLSFLGSLRSVSQMLAYDLSLGLTTAVSLIYCESFNLYKIIWMQSEILWVVWLSPYAAFIFFICMLAELKRVPFDLPEAESELVSGYNTEYSGFLFALFFLAEYSSIVLFSNFYVILFFGGWGKSQILSYFWLDYPSLIDFILYDLKVLFFIWLTILIRATYARWRYDQLIELGWKILLPCSIGVFFLAVIGAWITS